MKHNEPKISAFDFITDLASRGQYSFTTEAFINAQNSTPTAARAALRRLKEQGMIAAPFRSFWVIVPPEYRALECLPAEQFIPDLMAHLKEPYYVSLLSAAQYHGAAHHSPQIFQIMTRANKPVLRCGKIAIEFVAKRNASEMPTEARNTKRGSIKLSTPELTALDLIGYYQHCGGLDNVATVLSELSEQMDGQKLLKTATFAPIAWVQRLGYLLRLVGADKITSEIAALIEKENPKIAPLIRGPSKGAPKDRIFRVAINMEVEPDL